MDILYGVLELHLNSNLTESFFIINECWIFKKKFAYIDLII